MGLSQASNTPASEADATTGSSRNGPADVQVAARDEEASEQASVPGVPGWQAETSAERFLQHALGTQGDVRLPSLLLATMAMVAVVFVAWRRARERRMARQASED